MVTITQLADAEVTWSFALILLSWLLWRGHKFAAAHWAAATLFGFTVSPLLKFLLQIPRPGMGIPGLLPYSFPSGHTLKASVFFGFLAILVASELRQHRWFPYAGAALLISAIGLSRLYLGAHWLSDVLGSMVLGLTWTALLGLAYQRRSPPKLGRVSLSGALGSLILIIVAHLYFNHGTELSRYTPNITRSRVHFSDLPMLPWVHKAIHDSYGFSRVTVHIPNLPIGELGSGKFLDDP